MNRTVLVACIASITTATLAMPFFFGADSLSTRKLDDIAVMGVPEKMKEEWYKDDRERWLDRFVLRQHEVQAGAHRRDDLTARGRRGVPTIAQRRQHQLHQPNRRP